MQILTLAAWLACLSVAPAIVVALVWWSSHGVAAGRLAGGGRLVAGGATTAAVGAAVLGGVVAAVLEGPWFGGESMTRAEHAAAAADLLFCAFLVTLLLSMVVAAFWEAVGAVGPSALLVVSQLIAAYDQARRGGVSLLAACYAEHSGMLFLAWAVLGLGLPLIALALAGVVRVAREARCGREPAATVAPVRAGR